MTIADKLIIGESYTLRNGLKTSQLRYSNNNTKYIYEADIAQENDSIYVLAFKENGKYLGDDINNRYDIIITNLND
jgi:thermostable 8-oxoguanine DNA glycosylase